MQDLIKGVTAFQENVFPAQKTTFAQSDHTQSPVVMFITSYDPGIDPFQMTQAIPRQLYVYRNAGNIVTPYGSGSQEMTAAIEHAVAGLNVSHIIVCGHTNCSVMKAALTPTFPNAFSHLRSWLGYASAALKIVEELAKGKSDDERQKMLVEQNVMLQLTHLVTHPAVAARLAKRNIELHGWVFDNQTGQVSAFDETLNRFVPVKQKYAVEKKSNRQFAA